MPAFKTGDDPLEGKHHWNDKLCDQLKKINAILQVH